jgi:dGTPase
MPAPADDAYDEASRARWVDEPPKRPGRSDFERDRARVLHASSLRRLAAKTQVVLPWTDDFVRNRLTHSLEVAQVGRELGRALGCDPDVVETACLAHDLGHPPFGHNGESALDEVTGPIGGFEGNAQTLRLLTRLEAKTFDAAGRSVGLNLTRASLDAATKYPWPRAEGDPKFGVYADDLEVFTWLREGAPERRRCLEAQVMDWADDVAYSVHDVEDAVVAGKLDLRALDSRQVREELFATARQDYAPDAERDELADALSRLTGSQIWPRTYDGSRRDLAALKDLTSELIGRFCTAAEAATRARFGSGPLARYAADLAVPRSTALEVAVLKGMAGHFVIRAEDRTAALQRQRTMLHNLVALLAERGPEALLPAYAADWRAAGDDAARLRVVVDAVASLTDPSAVALHRSLTGAG